MSIRNTPATLYVRIQQLKSVTQGFNPASLDWRQRPKDFSIREITSSDPWSEPLTTNVEMISKLGAN